MHTRLKELRLKLNLSLAQMGDDLNVSASAISLYENGKRNLTDRTIADLERVYNVNPVWLKTGEGQMFKEKTKAMEIAEITANLFNSVESDLRFKLIKIVNNLSDEQLEAFRDIAKQLLEDSENKGE